MFKFIKIYKCTMEKREAIVAALLAGKTNKEVVEQLKVSAKTVYNVKKRFEAGKGLGHQSGAGRPKSVTTPRLINAIKSRVARNPVQTMRGMARDLNVSEKTVRRIVKKNLKAKSFARNQKSSNTPTPRPSRPPSTRSGPTCLAMRSRTFAPGSGPGSRPSSRQRAGTSTNGKILIKATYNSNLGSILSILANLHVFLYLVPIDI